MLVNNTLSVFLARLSTHKHIKLILVKYCFCLSQILSLLIIVDCLAEFIYAIVGLSNNQNIYPVDIYSPVVKFLTFVSHSFDGNNIMQYYEVINLLKCVLTLYTSQHYRQIHILTLPAEYNHFQPRTWELFYQSYTKFREHRTSISDNPNSAESDQYNTFVIIISYICFTFIIVSCVLQS